MKKIVILGVTGSIGIQGIDVCSNNRDLYEVVKVAGGYNITKLVEIIDTNPSIKEVAIINEIDALFLKERYPHLMVYHGQEGILQLLENDDYDIVLNGIIGFAGLMPSLKTIEKQKVLALANKETMVVAGHIVLDLLKQYPQAKIIPVDSEHSALFQCLNGERRQDIKQLIITASGGSFRDKTLEELEGVTVEQALNHPNWSMGAKITIDSATMFNKGLEVIEARWLFDIDYDQIDVVIHYESIIHSMIKFNDLSIMAQLSKPDMRHPIQYAFSYPERIELKNGHDLDFGQLASLTFKPVDYKRFKALALAYEAGKTGHSKPTVLNAAKEVATDLFLENKITFLAIVELVEQALNAHQLVLNPTLDQIHQVDAWARQFVLESYQGGI